VELQSETYQEAGSEHFDGGENSRQMPPVMKEDRSSTSETALMVRPIAGPLQVLAER
jgi:hypothetical protein